MTILYFACRHVPYRYFNRHRPRLYDVRLSRFYATAASAAAPVRSSASSSSHTQQAIPSSPSKRSSPTVMSSGSSTYLETLYEDWRLAPESIEPSWRSYFEEVWDSRGPNQNHAGVVSPSAHSLAGTKQIQFQHFHDRVKVRGLVRAYEERGHLRAQIDPIGLRPKDGGSSQGIEELDPAHHGLRNDQLDQEFTLGPDLLPGFIKTGQSQSTTLTLREIIAACERVYASTYSVEYNHVSDPQKVKWLRERCEVPNATQHTADGKKNIYDALIRAITFERFLAAKFPNVKRFGVEGAEGIIPAVQTVIDRSADTHGIEQIYMSSCHRGKLTMLGSLYGKPYDSILAEFNGQIRSDYLPGMAGDVKYHLGHDGPIETPGGNNVAMSVLANPSHLESATPVATGKTRAAQHMMEREAPREDLTLSPPGASVDKVMCFTTHGDAAFTGQGVVYETLGLGKLDAYDVGGTVRIILNNQVGFTTDWFCSRSTPYPSDLAKWIEAPIFHVNGDDFEAVAFVCRLAADWRATFHTDVIIDLVCYRRAGHNEMDQPRLTQPSMYRAIDKLRSALDVYEEKLVMEGVLTRSEVDERHRKQHDVLTKAFKRSKSILSERSNYPQPAWKDLVSPMATAGVPEVATAVAKETLSAILDTTTTIPEGFAAHPGLQRVLTGRKSAWNGEESLDWATAESLAIGSLALEGYPIRIAGQDVQRGTFSQRHATWTDQNTNEAYTPLANLSRDQAPVAFANSPLSEYAALGFEYGMTLADPQSLVIWEAQFGDFANNCQVMIDNLISSGESKWLDHTGIVLSLPHGFDGQAAEHSSARIDRFLQLCDEDGLQWPTDAQQSARNANMEVVYMSSPANYFHVLRRQQKRDYRKPLVIIFSKKMLRHPFARSKIAELTGKSSFKAVIGDAERGDSLAQKYENVKRVIICTGQVSVALRSKRAEEGLNDVAIITIEQLHPFPWTEVLYHIKRYPDAKTIVWAQEEPYNGGPWQYMRDRLETVLRQEDSAMQRKLVHVSRPINAAAATGIAKNHVSEEEKLLRDAFGSR